MYAIGKIRVAEVHMYRLVKRLKQQHTYVVGQLSSCTRHHVLAVAALDTSLSMVDDVDMSAPHSCVVVVDLWQSPSEWHLLLSACFGVLPRVCQSSN